ncbi:MAG: PEP-CTERM sorting domain-containing protein [Lentisphaeria bacterium]
MKRLLGIVAGLMLVEPALLAATINYSENFDSWVYTVIPTSASSASSYWYVDNGSMVSGMVWGGGGPDKSSWLWTPDWMSAYTGNAYRNFRTAGTLTVGESIANATLTAYVRQNNGLDDNTSLYASLSLLDSVENGYVGLVNRAGGITIYKSVGGMLTSIKTGTSIGGDAKYCTLSVIDGTVTFSYYYVGSESTVYTTTVADSTYRSFTTLGLGTQYSYGETQGFDNVTLTGMVVPEPATAGLLAVAGALVMLRRRKQ